MLSESFKILNLTQIYVDYVWTNSQRKRINTVQNALVLLSSRHTFIKTCFKESLDKYLFLYLVKLETKTPW